MVCRMALVLPTNNESFVPSLQRRCRFAHPKVPLLPHNVATTLLVFNLSTLPLSLAVDHFSLSNFVVSVQRFLLIRNFHLNFVFIPFLYIVDASAPKSCCVYFSATKVFDHPHTPLTPRLCQILSGFVLEWAGVVYVPK